MIDKLLVVGILVFACAAAVADEGKVPTYRWEDAQGNVYYSDLPPPAEARNVVRRNTSAGAPDVSLPYELQLAVKKYPVTIYITTDCGELCDKASALLIERGVPHTQLDAMQPEANQRVTDLTNGQPAVPLVEIGKIVVQGFEEGRWNAALDKAGYPRDAMIAVTPNVPVADSAATASTDDVDADAEADADADADATADADEDSDIYEPGVFEPAQYEVEE